MLPSSAATVERVTRPRSWTTEELLAASAFSPRPSPNFPSDPYRLLIQQHHYTLLGLIARKVDWQTQDELERCEDAVVAVRGGCTTRLLLVALFRNTYPRSLLPRLLVPQFLIVLD